MDGNQIVTAVVAALVGVGVGYLLAALAAPRPAAAPKPAPDKPSGEPLRLLALLQRDARLIDFLTEDVSGATDEQVGEFARKMQTDAKKVIDRHLVLGPVIGSAEGDTVEVAAGFDPSAVRLTGNVTGQPPFRGTLKHQGWRVKQVKLDPPPAGQDLFVLMPAEVELP